RRKRLLTSITAAPAAAARGACSPATPGPAAKKASSTPSKACGVRSAIFSLRPASSTSAPAVRYVPRRRIEPTGNWRCPSSSRISRPTSPAGPTTAIVSSVAIPGSVAQDSDLCKDPRIAEAGGGGGTGTLSLRGGVRRRCSALLPVAGPGRTRRLLSLGEIPATRFVRQLPCRREPLGARAACVNILADERVQKTERPDGKEPRSVRSRFDCTRTGRGDVFRARRRQARRSDHAGECRRGEGPHLARPRVVHPARVAPHRHGDEARPGLVHRG